MTGGLRRAEQRIELWAKHFRVGSRDYYPRGSDSGGAAAGFHAALASLDPSEWHQVSHEWPMHRTLWYIEQRRVQRAFDRLQDS